jgi:phosphopantetheine--protein transferase-like protein
MILEQDIVFLYFFDANDSRSTDEKIVAAAALYANTNKIPTLSDPVVHRTERGKPYIAGESGIGVSVSHSGEWVVCALTEGKVGVDIEHHRQSGENNISKIEERFSQIAKRFFHPDEAEFVKEDPHRRFYKIWTAKESYVKYTGTGMDETFGEHSVLSPVLIESESRMQDNSFCWKSEDVYFRQMPYKEEYTLCVCKANKFDIKISYI